MDDILLTICIPIGPGHEQIAQRARDSVKAQTIPVNGSQITDSDGRGAGWTRNQLLANVTTPYVAFLDADDWIEPMFAEEMLRAVTDSEYVYSAWMESDPGGAERLVVPSAKCYCFEPDNWWNVHLITSVIPTEWLRAIGGFDESLPGMEDTDMFHRLRQAGHCGRLLNKPLVHYTADGKRSKSFQARNDYQAIKENIGRRYNTMEAPCCQGDGIHNDGPFGDPQPGDVLARANGPAFQIYVGRQSGRIYANVGHGQLVWADPADVASDPIRFTLADASASDVGAFMQSRVITGLATEPSRPAKQGKKTASDLAKMAGFGDA